MAMKNLSRGFTLIELLVVLTVIGIMATIVLGFLGSARQKGTDAAIKNNLSNIRTRAQLLYELSTPNTYSGVCTDSNVTNMLNAAPGATCDNQQTTWRASAPLKAIAGKWWCVDQTGVATTETADPNSPLQHTCP